MSTNAELLWMLVAHLVLTALPGALVVLLALRRGVRSVPVLLGLALAGSGLVAMLAFWAYYATPELGRVASLVVIFGSVLGIVQCWRRGLDREILRQLAPPLLLWVLGSAFVLFLGFLHGGTAHPLLTASTRYSQIPLPFDNIIPKFFADWFFVHGHHGTPPPIGDWLASDRPPLQIGYALSQRPIGWGSELHYQVLGVVIQQLWIIGMWSVLSAARIRPLARGLAMFAAMVSDIAILHGFFVWPKLIAAAFVLVALSLVISEDWVRLRGSPYATALFASLCGFALLAHGSSIFFILPLLVLAAARGLPGPRCLGIAALVGFALLAPWSAYQRFADPPGNRLIKWQLGGSLKIDERGALKTILDGYRHVGVSGTLSNKWNNVAQVGGGGVRPIGPAVRTAVDESRAGRFGNALSALRLARFFALLPFLGVLMIGPIAMLVARARGRPEGAEWVFALSGLTVCGLACLVWVLLMFGGPGSTATIHVGSLAVPLLAVCACVVGADAISTRLATALVAFNALAVLALYAPSLNAPSGTVYSPLAAVIAALSLVGFGLVVFRHAARSTSSF